MRLGCAELGCTVCKYSNSGWRSLGLALSFQAALPDKLTRAQQRMDPADLIRQLGLDVDVSLVRAAGPAAGNLQQRILPHKWRGAALAAHATDLSGKSVLTIADWKRRAGDY